MSHLVLLSAHVHESQSDVRLNLDPETTSALYNLFFLPEVFIKFFKQRFVHAWPLAF